MNKQKQRNRRASRTRHTISRLNENRLTVHRTSQHIYAQIIDPTGSRVLASASSVDKEVRGNIKSGGNIAAATEVGKLVAKRAMAAGVKRVAFDRSGFKYHGRIKALADAAREGGVEF